MTNELEETFFDAFGIEPHYYCADEYVFEAMLEYECTEGNREKCKTCKKVGKSYPQISDRILLELICILSEWRQYCDSDYVIKAINIDTLKEDILKDCLYMLNWYEFKKCGKDIKHQVQALFKEG